MKKALAILFVTALLFGGIAASTSAAPLDGGIVLYGNDPGTGGH